MTKLKSSKKQIVRKTVETLMHDEASRKNIPTAEYQSVIQKEDQAPVRVAYERRNRDLDPQLVWRGKDEQDWSDLVVHAPLLYIQEKVHPKVLIDDLLRRAKATRNEDESQPDLFAAFNGLPDDSARTEFYQHDQNWSNRMILGDSLQVMASLAEREGLRGKVQCIYLDPPYGIKFNSNFQWSTTSRDVRDGKVDHITREPEQVKAFRDTWQEGIHSYLTYLRDRLTVARDLLTDSGSIFVQIGDENVHRVRAVMDEVFGDANFVSQISIQKTGGFSQSKIGNILDHVLWYAKSGESLKYRPLNVPIPQPPVDDPNYVLLELSDGSFRRMTTAERTRQQTLPGESRVFRFGPLQSEGASKSEQKIEFEGESFLPSPNSHWKTNPEGMHRVGRAGKLLRVGKTIYHRLYWDSFSAKLLDNIWLDTQSGGFNEPKVYVVQTTSKVIQRCLLMATDPGDLVLDPTCGSGTTATVAEQWGRRWITIDTSRVALTLARTRVMGARYPFYLLADSREGQLKVAELTGTAPSSQAVHGNIRHGFVYERVPHITLKSIANNAEIDVIWERYQETLEPLREQLNGAMGKNWEEWEIPRHAEDPWDHGTREIFYNLRQQQSDLEANQAELEKSLAAINHNLNRHYTLETLPERPADPWPEPAHKLHAEWWRLRIRRQNEIDASIASKAEFEYLYDKPYVDNKKVRVAGPFTVESLSPHRVLAVDEDDELIHSSSQSPDGEETDFVQMILENLKIAGVQQAHKEDKINFSSLAAWPGRYISAEGRYVEADSNVEKRAGVFIGPEFGTVSRPDLVEAAREAGDANFDVLISCAFNYDAHSSEFKSLGRIPILKARMNADLHMSDELKNTGKGNLFVVFGEPDIEILDAGPDGDLGQIRVKVNGVDVFHPNTGEIRSDGPEGIACWFIDTDYNGESFFVRHAYFLGQNDPYKALKTTLKAEINEEAWATLHCDTSRPFDKPDSGRIAVKVINHLGDEVMKVFKVT
jgi:adenine-specific DNA-methyltransferase